MKRSVLMLVSFAFAIMVAMPLASAAAAMQATPEDAANPSANLQSATSWLIGQQQENGGFAGLSGEPEVSITVDAIIALVSAQLSGADVGTSIDDAVAFIESGDKALVYAQTGAGQSAKLVLGSVAWGGNPHSVAQFDPLSLVQAGPAEEGGLYGDGVYNHALALLALGATDSEVPEAAITALEDTQAPGGGWAFDGTTDEGAADSNTTSLVIMALVATGHGDSQLVSDGLAYLQTTLVDDTGATFQPADGAVADANSTAFVLQAVIAAGDDPAAEGWGDLPAALATFQNDSGAFFYNETETSDNLFSTVQAIPALAGLALPVVPEGFEMPATPVNAPVGLTNDRSVPAAA